MTSLRRSFVFAFTTLTCGVLASGCDDVISDPNFHTWCGAELCSWKLESGHIQRAPTWHPKDYGVELLDSTEGDHVTAISQVVVKKPRCLEFSTVADVLAEAQVSIQLDFNNDGVVDYEQPIAETGFREQKNLVTAPVDYDTVRFIIAKKGHGRAVLAQMFVKSTSNCTGEPLVLKAQPLGIACQHDDACTSAVCCEGRCAECCTTGPAACSGGGKCERRANASVPTGSEPRPLQCDPGKGKHDAGRECLLDDDCRSGVCEGAVWRVYDENLSPCPEAFPYSPACFIGSVHAGRCK